MHWLLFVNIAGLVLFFVLSVYDRFRYGSGAESVSARARMIETPSVAARSTVSFEKSERLSGWSRVPLDAGSRSNPT